jgi:hypothetical protein
MGGPQHPPRAKDPWAEMVVSATRGRLGDHASRWARGSTNDEGTITLLEVWGYADLVLDLTPATGRIGWIRETSRLEAVLGKTHCTTF